MILFQANGILQGAKYVCRFMTGGKGIDVGYVAHPSYVFPYYIHVSSADHSSFVDEEELAAITGPLSIAAAEVDEIFPTEKRHKSEEILAKSKNPYQITLYSGVVHGFSVRCDVSKKQEKFAKEQAFLQAVTWFDEYLV
jgi:dienelactone hydrolase